MYLVFGGELTQCDSIEFKDPTKLDIVGIFPSHEEAYTNWLEKARATIDIAQMRYFLIDIQPHLS